MWIFWPVGQIRLLQQCYSNRGQNVFPLHVWLLGQTCAQDHHHAGALVLPPPAAARSSTSTAVAARSSTNITQARLLRVRALVRQHDGEQRGGRSRDERHRAPPLVEAVDSAPPELAEGRRCALLHLREPRSPEVRRGGDSGRGDEIPIEPPPPSSCPFSARLCPSSSPQQLAPNRAAPPPSKWARRRKRDGAVGEEKGRHGG